MIVKLTNIPINNKMMNDLLTALNNRMYRLSSARLLDGGFSEVSIVDIDNGAVHLAWRWGHQSTPDPIPEPEAEVEEMTYDCWLPLKMTEDASIPMECKLSFTNGKWRRGGYKIETWSQKQLPNGVIETQTVTDKRTCEWPDAITSA